MSNFEMLTLQLKEFEKYYELAVAHHLSSIIFIHGLGTGRLRDDLHELLRLKKEVKTFVNQYHPSYGYGATEVYLQY
jgi:dsDNA-specific endonuclease/ATPase MutS2